MTSITRTKLLVCRVKDCPAPESEEWHIPWCLAIPDVPHTQEGQHQHWPKRSQGGKEIVAFPCAYCHDRIDNADWGNAVLPMWYSTNGDVNNTGGRLYRAWDRHNNTLIERVISPPWWEIPNGTDDSGRGNQAVPRVLRPDLVSGEELVVDVLPESQGGRAVPGPAGHEVQVRDGDEGEDELDGARTPLASGGGDPKSGAVVREPVAVSPDRGEPVQVRGVATSYDVEQARQADGYPATALTFDQWAAEVRIWAKTYRSMGWIFGDLCLKGLDLWGDEAHQAIDRELGVDEGTIANWLTTCRIWPPESRRHEASFTMHALLNATRRKDPEEADRMLDEAIREGRTSSEVRALLSGPTDSHECPDCGQTHRRKA